MIRVILHGKHRNFNDYKEFVTEIGDLEKETFFKLIKKRAETIEAENRELSTDNIQYAAKFVDLYASVGYDCKHAGEPRRTGKGIRPNQR